MTTRRDFLRLAASAPALLSASTVRASGWPSQSPRIVVPFAPGGTTDLVARIVAGAMSDRVGQQVLVENRAGGGGTIGADAVAKGPRDGYTLGVATVSTHAIAPALMTKPPYHPVNDFEAIAILAVTPLAVIVHPSVGASTLDQLRATASAQPGQLNFASPGNGSLGHLSGLLFNKIAKVETKHIPYRGSAPALQDLLAGRVQIMFDNVPTPLPHIRAGAIRALAITAPSRLPALPDVQTATEAGFPDLQIISWTILVAPAGTPADVVTAINRAVNEALADATVRARLDTANAEPRGGTVADAKAFLAAESAKWGELARASGATIQ